MFARTPRLLLRPGWKEDASALAAAIGDFAVVSRLARAPWPYGLDDAEGFLSADHGRLPNFLIFARTHGSPRLVGGIGLDQTELAIAESMTGSLRDKINKFNRVRKRPLLVIHLVSAGPQIEGSKLEHYCVSLSFCMRTTHKPVREQAYQVNEVFRRTMLEPFDAEAEDDADHMLEAGL